MSKNTNAVAVETLSISEVSRALSLYSSKTTVVIQSEPGCGKSSLLGMLAEKHGDQWRKSGDHFPDDKYVYIYVDCPTKDIPDIGQAIPVHASKRMEYYSNELFEMRDPRPHVIMLDEFMKGPKMLQIMFTRLMLERMVGECPLPEGSLVFATSNNQTDGVGDTMLAHAGNRVMLIRMEKPDDETWSVWATNKGLTSLIRAWVKMVPSCLKSYLDPKQEDNPYIFNPTRRNLSFVSPRSLEKADHIIRNRHIAGEKITRVALAGTVGQAAAESMSAFFAVEEELLSPRDILKDPSKATVSSRPIVLLMTLFNLVDVVETQSDVTAAMIYVKRIESSEIQAVFFSMMVQSDRTMKLARLNMEINNWVASNFQLLM